MCKCQIIFFIYQFVEKTNNSLQQKQEENTYYMEKL